MTQYYIKGWSKFQHFKDRRPPWIKLYRDLLDDMEWHELDGDSAKTLISLWLIASENEGQLPDMRKLAFRLRMSEKVLSAQISKLEHWLSTSDIALSPDRYHDDAPETETETETEKNMSGPAVPDAFDQFWKAYPRTPNMSKAAALKSWQKQKSQLPPQNILLQAVAKYREFLATETKKSGRDYPAKHAQGWLTERRWEGFAEKAQTQQPASHSQDWADDIPAWQAFKKTITPSEWQAWFANTHPNGSIASLVVKNTFELEQMSQRYLPKLTAHFGENFEVKVKQ